MLGRPRIAGQMKPEDVLETLEASGVAPDALNAIGKRIIAVESVSVADLAATGLSGSRIIAVRRALAKPSNTTVRGGRDFAVTDFLKG